MRVYEALATGFVEEGTSAVFGMMGDTTLHWFDALTKLGVEVFKARHEGPGLAMAEGWTTITGQPGVCTTTSGPGVTQLATTMVRASRARTPLVAFCGDEKVGDDEHHHAFDQARFAAAIECGFVRVSSPAAAYHAVQKAFHLARVESRPIMLSAPLDVQLAQFDESDEYVCSSDLLTNLAIYPNPSSIDKVADLVVNSERIVLLVGRGAMRSGAATAVKRLADLTGALVATSLMAMNWPPDSGEYHVGISGLFSTGAAIELFREADCVIAAGASLNHYTTAHGYLYPSAKIVQFDTASQVVMGDGRSADYYVQCDARIGLEVLADELVKRMVEKVGYRTSGVKDRLANALDDPVAYDLEPGTLDPRDVSRVLDEIIPREMGLAIYGAQAAQMAIMLCRTSRPYTHVTKHFGSMGSGTAAVIGMSIATGRKPVVLIDGDFSFMMHLSEFETVVRYQLPLLVVIFNNQADAGDIHIAMQAKEGVDANLARIPTPDLGLVGVALGGRGFLVRTLDELRNAVAEFIAEPGPMLLDVRVSSNVESIPRRRLNGNDAI